MDILQYVWDNRVWIAASIVMVAAVLALGLLILGASGQAPFVYTIF